MSYPIYENQKNLETFPFPFHIMLKKSGESYAPHHHDFFEMSFFVDGQAAEMINGVSYQTRRGILTYKLPHQVHETICTASQWFEKYNLMFDMDILLESKLDQQIRDYFHRSRILNASSIEFRDEDSEKIEHILQNINYEYNHQKLMSKSYIRARLVELLILILRTQADQQDTAQHEITPPTTHVKLWEIVHYISNHFWDRITLSTLSEQFQVSPSHISRLFKQYTGQQFTTYLNGLRIRHACSLLLSSQMKISEIAVEVGYESFKTFSRVFREKKGLPPSSYRQTYKKTT